MNKKIFIAAIFVIGLSMIAIALYQSNNSIDGIANLKIGMSEKELRDVVDIALLEENINDFVPGDKLYGKKKSFRLKKYTISDGYNIEDISLHFFEDKLYDIYTSTYNPKTEKMLVEKYGIPKTTVYGYTVKGEPEKNEMSNVIITYTFKNRIRGISCTINLDPCKKKYSIDIQDDDINKEVFYMEYGIRK